LQGFVAPVYLRKLPYVGETVCKCLAFHLVYVRKLSDACKEIRFTYNYYELK